MAYLRENYKALGLSRVAMALGRTQRSVQVKASKIGISTKIPTCDITYFDTIDSSEKAYWLGFIVADGYVYIGDRSYILGIELSKKDRDHLVTFLECIRSSGKVCERVRYLHGCNACDMSSVRVYSKHVVESLAKYGVVQNKTQQLSRIIVPGIYIWDYIRGYFDGDGSFDVQHITKSNGHIGEYGRVSFICHRRDFLEDLGRVLIQDGIETRITADGDNYKLYIRKQDSLIRFYQRIYGDECAIKLPRKYEKFHRYISYKFAPHNGDAMCEPGKKSGRLNREAC